VEVQAAMKQDQSVALMETHIHLSLSVARAAGRVLVTKTVCLVDVVRRPKRHAEAKVVMMPVQCAVMMELLVLKDLNAVLEPVSAGY
jgi:hypothetical protein